MNKAHTQTQTQTHTHKQRQRHTPKATTQTHRKTQTRSHQKVRTKRAGKFLTVSVYKNDNLKLFFGLCGGDLSRDTRQSTYGLDDLTNPEAHQRQNLALDDMAQRQNHRFSAKSKHIQRQNKTIQRQNVQSNAKVHLAR